MQSNAKRAAPSPFGGLRPLHEVHPLLRDVFPAESGLYWFIRQNRQELAEAGAILKFGGPLMIEPQRFIDTATRIAARRAALPPK